ncbi:MAG TPA: hypothetical protein DEQ02_04385 [Ruminococcaceae bacterium]|nr:hypothetical protein [Oscillospiraceae bacterium]
MKTYKRALITMLMGILGAPFAGLIAVMVGSFFIEDLIILISIGIGLCCIILFITIFNENIKFTLSENGQLCYYKRGHLKSQFDIPNCYVGYRRKTTDATDHDITLRILPVGKEEIDTITIDASPLGRNRFEKMFVELEKIAANQVEILTVTPK